jgi:hypothetical protein
VVPKGSQDMLLHLEKTAPFQVGKPERADTGIEPEFVRLSGIEGSQASVDHDISHISGSSGTPRISRQLSKKTHRKEALCFPFPLKPMFCGHGWQRDTMRLDPHGRFLSSFETDVSCPLDENHLRGQVPFITAHAVNMKEHGIIPCYFIPVKMIVYCNKTAFRLFYSLMYRKREISTLRSPLVGSSGGAPFL